METSLGSGKQFSTLLQTRSGEAPPTLYCTKDLKAKTNFSRAHYNIITLKLELKISLFSSSSPKKLLLFDVCKRKTNGAT